MTKVEVGPDVGSGGGRLLRLARPEVAVIRSGGSAQWASDYQRRFQNTWSVQRRDNHGWLR